MFSSCAYLLATKEAFQGRGFPNSGFEICALIWDLPIALGMLICINIQNNPSQDSCYLGLKGPSFLCALCKWTCRPNLSLLDSLKYSFHYLVEELPSRKVQYQFESTLYVAHPQQSGHDDQNRNYFFFDKITLLQWGLQLLRKMWAILTSLQEENGIFLRFSVC